MEQIVDHKTNDANDALEITRDEPSTGGASHVYDIRWDVGGGCQGCTRISFQHGPITEVGRNGVTNEALLAIVLDRLRGFQSGDFKCRENALAITKIEEAMHWLNHRTNDRVRRGVEGRNAA